MKKKYTKRAKIFNFTPDMIEIEKIIKKFPSETKSPDLIEQFENNNINGEIRVDKVYRFKNNKGQLSPAYIWANEYDRGYAVVMSQGEYFYIDTDYTTVICEDKIENCKDLYEIIKSNPESVLKYVSVQKMEELRDPVATEFLLGEGDRKQARYTDRMLQSIDGIITKKLETFA